MQPPWSSYIVRLIRAQEIATFALSSPGLSRDLGVTQIGSAARLSDMYMKRLSTEILMRR